MSIRSYLAIMFCLFLSFFVGVVYLLGGPQIAAYQTPGQLLPKLPVGAAVMTAVTFRLANDTPPERRTGFWAYRDANIALACIVILTAIGLSQLRLPIYF